MAFAFAEEAEEEVMMKLVQLPRNRTLATEQQTLMLAPPKIAIMRHSRSSFLCYDNKGLLGGTMQSYNRIQIGCGTVLYSVWGQIVMV
jgi:hypothetical protein